MKHIPKLALGALLIHTATVQGQQPVREMILPKSAVRALLPADGAVFHQVIKANVWPENKQKGPFFQHEAAEFALGLGLRAKEGDRRKERPMLPGVTFNQGWLGLQGGWRAHKKVDIHNDFFDGTLRGQVYLGYAGGETFVDAQVQVDWNESLLSRVLFPVSMIVVPFIEAKAENTIESKVRAELPAKMDGAISDFLRKLQLPQGMKEFVVADVLPDGIRLRLYNDRTVSRRAKVPDIAFKVAKTGGGDKDFGGNGPRVRVTASLEVSSGSVDVLVKMHAKETKKDWTEGVGELRKTLYKATEGETILSVMGEKEFTLLNHEVNGHDPQSYRTRLGVLKVYGDHKGDDVGGYTGMELSKGAELRIITTRKP
jgi:hypothetical protein